MKNILLATTALVMTAGVASAEITWTGTVTAGIARDGATVASNGVVTAAMLTAIAKTSNRKTTTVVGGTTAFTNAITIAGAALTPAEITTWLAVAQNRTDLEALRVELATAATTSAMATLTTNIAAQAAWLASNKFAELNATAGGTATWFPTNFTVGGLVVDVLGGTGVGMVSVVDAGDVDDLDELYLAVKTAHAANTAVLAGLQSGATTAAVVAGDYKTYSEVNLDGAASVTTDSGLTFKTQISINAGQGYDLADDDGFDTAAANGRNGGSVGLDYVSVGGAFGTITIDEGDIAMLVDADDNKSGDISYKGTFGDVTVQAVFDQAKDGNAVAVAADVVRGIAGNQTSNNGNGVDVAWSAAVSGAVQGVSYRYATDEEGGYAGSLGYTMSGLTLGLSTKLEAWEKDLNKPVHNGVSVAYAVEGLSINGAWDSVKDGNQTSWGVGYTGGDATVGFNTNEKNEWTATASLALGAGASLNAGVNYTDDAQVGVSFSF